MEGLACYFESGENERFGHLRRRVYLHLSGRVDHVDTIYVGKIIRLVKNEWPGDEVLF